MIRARIAARTTVMTAALETRTGFSTAKPMDYAAAETAGTSHAVIIAAKEATDPSSTAVPILLIWKEVET